MQCSPQRNKCKVFCRRKLFFFQAEQTTQHLALIFCSPSSFMYHGIAQSIIYHDFKPLLTKLSWSGLIKGLTDNNADASVGESEHSKESHWHNQPQMLLAQLKSDTSLNRLRHSALIYKGPQTQWSTAAKSKDPAWSHFTLISIALLVFVDTIYIAKAQCMQKTVPAPVSC